RPAAGVARPPAAPPAAAEELDALRDDLGDVALVAVLVVVLPGAHGALDEHLPALGEVLPAGLGLLPPHDHVVPLGALLALALVVGPDVAGRHREPPDRLTARREAYLRVAPDIADDQDPVERHAVSLLPRSPQPDDSPHVPVESTRP